MAEQPILPYGGESDPNSGFSGSATSEARARTEDRSGITGARQRAVREVVAAAGAHGVTWREVAVTLNLHHGQASASLSNLHRAGRISRLDIVRNRCKVYVGNFYVEGRATEEPGSNAANTLLDEMALVLRRVVGSCPHIRRQADCIPCTTKDLLRRYEARL